MVSRENRIIAACIAAALVLFLLVSSMDPPRWVPFAVVFGVGVVLPGILTGRYRG